MNRRRRFAVLFEEVRAILAEGNWVGRLKRYLPSQKACVLTVAILSIGSSFFAAQKGLQPAGRLAQLSSLNSVNYNEHVASVLRARCQSCHHPGDIAPFSLMSYDEAAGRAAAIKRVITSRKMPPWKPVSGCGDFDDARWLTDAELETLVRWADSGAPEGPVQEVAAPLPYPNQWILGEPDLVLAPVSDYTPDLSRGDVYRCFSIPTTEPADRYVTAVDIRPGNRSTVHHVLLFGDRTGASARLDEADPEPGYPCFGGAGVLTVDTLGAGPQGAGLNSCPRVWGCDWPRAPA